MSLIGMLILFISVFFIGWLFSMFGLGGGVLYTPIQVWMGIDFHVAATTSLFLIMATSLSSTLVYRKARKVDWPLAILLETTTTLGGLGGGLISGQFSGILLSVIFGVVVALAALFMIFDFPAPSTCLKGRGWLLSWHRSMGEEHYCVNLVLALPLSFVAGGISGLVGVGGGLMKIPMMVLLFGIPMDIAVGSSAFMVGLTASGGFAGHVVSGHWNWKISVILALAVIIGSQIGARMAVQINRKKLKKGFGVFLLAIAFMMVITAG